MGVLLFCARWNGPLFPIFFSCNCLPLPPSPPPLPPPPRQSVLCSPPSPQSNFLPYTEIWGEKGCVRARCLGAINLSMEEIESLRDLCAQWGSLGFCFPCSQSACVGRNSPFLSWHGVKNVCKCSAAIMQMSFSRLSLALLLDRLGKNKSSVARRLCLMPSWGDSDNNALTNKVATQKVIWLY